MLEFAWLTESQSPFSHWLGTLYMVKRQPKADKTKVQRGNAIHTSIGTETNRETKFVSSPLGTMVHAGMMHLSLPRS